VILKRGISSEAAISDVETPNPFPDILENYMIIEFKV
jgi:hypothetical protein